MKTDDQSGEIGVTLPKIEPSALDALLGQCAEAIQREWHATYALNPDVMSQAGESFKRQFYAEVTIKTLLRHGDGSVRAALWHQVAETLASELGRWGWGDMHYGHQDKQEQSVLDALAVYENAKALDA